jgi:hypothetical protein
MIVVYGQTFAGAVRDITQHHTAKDAASTGTQCALVMPVNKRCE